MSQFEKNVTFVIVCFRSNSVIEKCLESISSDCKVIIVENSNDVSIKSHLEKKYSNVQVLISGDNIGYGSGNNLGISMVKTKYVFILNPDTYLEKNTLKELSYVASVINDDFSILSPKIFDKKFINLESNKIEDFIEVDFVKGFAMLLNLSKINFDKVFDENFFLFLEEIDLCKRIKNIGGKIYVACKAKIHHYSKKSSGNEFHVELCRNWHWMWSLYYYNFKHFGLLVAYKTTLYKFISSLIKMLIAIIFFKKRKYLIYKYRLLGLINAYQGKNSWLRP